MANVPNYDVLSYGGTDGYQGDRAQIAFYDGNNMRRCCVDLDWRE